MDGWMDRKIIYEKMDGKDIWMVGCIKKIDGWVEGRINNRWMVGRRKK